MQKGRGAMGGQSSSAGPLRFSLRWVKQGMEGPHPLTAKVWKIRLDSDVTGADNRNARMKETQKKHKKKARKHKRKEHKRKGKGHHTGSGAVGATVVIPTTTSPTRRHLRHHWGGPKTEDRDHRRGILRTMWEAARRGARGSIWRGTGLAANTEFMLLNDRKHFHKHFGRLHGTTHNKMRRG